MIVIINVLISFICSNFVNVESTNPEIWKTIHSIGPAACILECTKYTAHCARTSYDVQTLTCELIQPNLIFHAPFMPPTSLGCDEAGTHSSVSCVTFFEKKT